MFRTFLGISLIMSVTLAGCMAKDFIKPSQTEIDEYIRTHPDLTELDKACVTDGRFEVGMSKGTVNFLLGEPKSLEIIQQPWAQQEKWTYKAGNYKVFYMEDGGVVGIEEND